MLTLRFDDPLGDRAYLEAPLFRVTATELLDVSGTCLARYVGGAWVLGGRSFTGFCCFDHALRLEGAAGAAELGCFETLVVEGGSAYASGYAIARLVGGLWRSFVYGQDWEALVLGPAP
jgi:hypothetical protein